MPTKKTAAKTATTKATETAETKTAAVVEEKKPTEKKTVAKKTATKKTTTAKKTAEKKTTTKKTTTAKKTTTKKTTTKKAVVKKSVQDYEDIINWKKGEANGMDWLYIEVKAADLLTEVEAGVDNLDTVCNAILNCMLEGDTFIVEPKAEDKVDAELTVRYYCDNLSPERKKYFAR